MFKRLIPIALLALMSCAVAQKPTPNSLNVVLNGQTRVVEYRLWERHPFVQAKDTYWLNWTPSLDDVHHLIDLAGCIRLEFASRRVVGVWRSDSIQGIAVGAELTPLAIPTRKTGDGEMWIPLDSVAQVMGYQSSFDPKKQVLTLKSNVRPDDRSFPGYCQYMLQPHQPSR